jgi:hypothetical protein
MYLAGVQKPTLRPAPISRGIATPAAASFGNQAAPPPGLKFSNTRGPSLTNAEMRAVTEWRFGKVTPTIVGGVPVWSTCGSKPGSGSPCNRQAIARFKQLQSQGMDFGRASAIMKAEGSFKHYAGF